MSILKLTEAPTNTKFRIKNFDLDTSSRQRLHTMGIHIKDLFIRQNHSNFGPILIQNLSNNSTKIALGRELAENIVIECSH